MPDLLTQPPKTAARAAAAHPPRPQRRRRSRAGVVSAFAAAVIGLLLVEAVALIAWIAEPRSAAPLSAALRTGGAFWLLGHGGRLELPAGTAALIPLGLAALFALLAARAGGAAARVHPSGRRMRVLLSSAGVVGVPYALVAVLVAVACDGGGLHPSVLSAFLGALILSTVGALVGAARELPPVTSQPRLRAVAAGVGAAGALLLAVSALMAAVALVTHLPDAAALARPAKAGAVGGVGLLVLQAALAPNAVIWSAAYVLGPGFAVGSATLVSPARAQLGDLPALPMLAALPAGAAPWPVYALFAVPPAAGVLAGIVMVRRLPATPRLATAALLGVAAAAAVGVLSAALALASGGPVTRGRLATVGPSPLWAGAAAALEIGIPGIVGALVITWRRQRSPSRIAVAPVSLVHRAQAVLAWPVSAAAAAGRLTGSRLTRAGAVLLRPFRARRKLAADVTTTQPLDLSKVDLKKPAKPPK